MEYINVPASQIMPVSGYELPLALKQIKKDAEDFFFSKGPLAYKIYKNSCAQSSGESKNKDAFIMDFINVLEESFKIQLKQNNQDITPAIKNVFEILRNSFRVLGNTNYTIEPITFFTSMVAFVLGKLK